MKKKQLIIAAIVGVLLVVGAIALFFTQTANAELGTLQVFEGDAKITRNNKEQTGTTGSPVRLHDVIAASPNSTVAIILKDNTVLRLEEGSKVEVAELSYEGEKIEKAVFKLTVGRLWSRVKPLGEGQQFEVETPTVTAAVRGTSFNTRYKDDRTGIYVYHHEVEVLYKTKKHLVSQDQLLTMRNDAFDEDFDKGPTDVPESFLDEWIIFNQEQDNELCQKWQDFPDCPKSTISPTVTPSVTPTPTKAVVKPKATLTPTRTPTPTDKPAATNTPAPAATNTPTPTPPVSRVSVSCPENSKDYELYTAQCSATAYGQNNNILPNATFSWSLAQNNGTITQSGFYDSPNSSGDTVKATYGGVTGETKVDFVQFF